LNVRELLLSSVNLFLLVLSLIEHFHQTLIPAVKLGNHLSKMSFKEFIK